MAYDCYYNSKKVKDIYLGTQNTNCLTSVPKNINLTLSNGTLTLKAGSKVYIPNGFESNGTTKKFDEVVISSDLYINDTGGTGKVMICVNAARGSAASSLSNCVSGNGVAHVNYGMCYDTSTNIIQRWGNGTVTVDKASFPLAILTLTDGKFTSIDQVFNGFGYIGSTGYILKGVKGLIPYGINDDGTYKSVKAEYTRVVTTEVPTYAKNRNKQPLFIAENNDIRCWWDTNNRGYYVTDVRTTGNYDVNYSPRDNLMYKTDGTAGEFSIKYRTFIGYLTTVDGKITSLTPATVQPLQTARRIKKIYKGSQLVWAWNPYTPETVLYENNDRATTKTLSLEDGVYELTLVGPGGGGGSSQRDSKWFQSSGGSGAAFKGLVYLPKGNYTFVVGTPGYGYNINNTLNCSGGGDGTNSYVQRDGTTILTAGVGGRGTVETTGGVGGTLTIGSINVVSSEISKNGNKGNYVDNGTVNSTSGYAYSAYDGTKTGYGAGTGSYKGGGGATYGGWVYGYNGYVKLKYVRAVV